MAAFLWSIPPDHYSVFVRTNTFAVRRRGRAALAGLRAGDRLFAYLPGEQVIAGVFEAVGAPFEDSTPLVRGGAFPNRVRVHPVVTLSEGSRVPWAVFADKLDVAAEYNGDLGAVVRQVLHSLPEVDAKVLEFLVRARQASDLDLENLFAAYDAYRRVRIADDAHTAIGTSTAREPAPAYATGFDYAEAAEHLIAYVAGQGYTYPPWVIAAYVAALRTKPFVVLGGVTGVGKTRLPLLVADATGGLTHLLPVRPDWTDAAEILGYTDLQGRFRPSGVLRAARTAQEDAGRHHTVVLDEMNLARVEHYFADVLSHLELRRPAANGGYATAPLLGTAAADAAPWDTVALPANLGLVGTVNMDEHGHAFSRKVLDRAFTLELAPGPLTPPPAAPAVAPRVWPVSAWYPLALRLADVPVLSEAKQALVARAVRVLEEANAILAPAHLAVGYRTRDEVALFVLHAEAAAPAFRTQTGTAVDPLDMALHMKLLPRLAGGSVALRRALFGLLGWAVSGTPAKDEREAEDVLAPWRAEDHPDALPNARFPRTAARLALMTERLLADGFTSYWT